MSYERQIFSIVLWQKHTLRYLPKTGRKCAEISIVVRIRISRNKGITEVCKFI